MRDSIRSPPLLRLGVVIRVRHDLMRAADKPLHAVPAPSGPRPAPEAAPPAPRPQPAGRYAPRSARPPPPPAPATARSQPGAPGIIRHRLIGHAQHFTTPSRHPQTGER